VRRHIFNRITSMALAYHKEYAEDRDFCNGFATGGIRSNPEG